MKAKFLLPLYFFICFFGIAVIQSCNKGSSAEAEQYSSIINQADADQKAQNDVNTNGQVYANTNGTNSISDSVSVKLKTEFYSNFNRLPVTFKFYQSGVLKYTFSTALVKTTFTVSIEKGTYTVQGIINGLGYSSLSEWNNSGMQSYWDIVPPNTSATSSPINFDNSSFTLLLSDPV